MREKGTIDASQYRNFLKDITKAYSVKSDQGKQILDTLNSTLVEIAEKARTYCKNFSVSIFLLSAFGNLLSAFFKFFNTIFFDYELFSAHCRKQTAISQIIIFRRLNRLLYKSLL